MTLKKTCQSKNINIQDHDYKNWLPPEEGLRKGTIFPKLYKPYQLQNAENIMCGTKKGG